MFVKIKEYGVLVPGERGVDGQWCDGSMPMEEAFKAHGVWIKQENGKSRADIAKEEQRKIAELPAKMGIREMSFQGCGLGDLTLRKVAHIMKFNTTLETLNVPWNRVADEGATFLGESLPLNRSLTSLDLGRNDIGDQGCEALCQGLLRNSSLTRLHLDFNLNIDVGGVQSIAGVVKTNPYITELGLSGISIRAQGATLLADALMANSTLTRLKLSEASIGPEGATALAKSLVPSGNQSLVSLDLSSNLIGKGLRTTRPTSVFAKPVSTLSSSLTLGI